MSGAIKGEVRFGYFIFSMHSRAIQQLIVYTRRRFLEGDINARGMTFDTLTKRIGIYLEREHHIKKNKAING